MVQIGPEKVREWSENSPRMIREWSENGPRWPENGPKMIPNRPGKGVSDQRNGSEDSPKNFRSEGSFFRSLSTPSLGRQKKMRHA